MPTRVRSTLCLTDREPETQKESSTFTVLT